MMEQKKNVKDYREAVLMGGNINSNSSGVVNTSTKSV